MKTDLDKLALEAYERMIKNLEASNKIVLEKIRQCFSLATFNLMFIATVFAFLKDSLSAELLGLKLSFIFSGSVLINVSSMYLGIRGIRLTEIYLKSCYVANSKQFDLIQLYIFNKSEDYSGLIGKLKNLEVTSKKRSFLTFCAWGQLLFVEIGLAITLIGILGLIFSPIKQMVR